MVAATCSRRRRKLYRTQIICSSPGSTTPAVSAMHLPCGQSGVSSATALCSGGCTVLSTNPTCPRAWRAMAMMTGRLLDPGPWSTLSRNWRLSAPPRSPRRGSPPCRFRTATITTLARRGTRSSWRRYCTGLCPRQKSSLPNSNSRAVIWPWHETSRASDFPRLGLPTRPAPRCFMRPCCCHRIEISDEIVAHG